MMEDKKDLISNEEFAKYIKTINDSIADISKAPLPKVKDSDLPSNLKIMLTGVGNDSKALDLLFSTKLDVVLEKLLDLIISGNIDQALESSEQLKMLFDKVGLGEGSFEGPVYKRFVNSVQTSMDSIKFNKTKNKIKKCYIVIKNLKKQTKYIKDKETRKKYKDTIYAFKKVIKIVSKVYKCRSQVNDKVLRGLNNIIKEDEQL